MATSRRFVTLTLVASVALAACTAAATPVPTTAPLPTAGVTPTTDGTLPKPELTTVKLGTPIGEVSQFNSVLADMLGLYTKYGLSVQITRFNAGGDAEAAVVGGAVDVGSNMGSSVMLTSQLTDSQVQALSVFKEKVFDGIFCGKDIKTAADMKGKAIAVSTLGTTAHASVLLALEALKMTDKDVTVMPVGGQSVRLAAMKGGSVACAPVSIDLQKDMEALGFNLIIDLSKSNLAYPSTGLGARTEFIKKNPNTILVLLAAQLEAQNILIKNPEVAAPKWAEFAQIDGAKALDQVKAAGPQLHGSMKCTVQGYAFSQKVLAIIQPSAMVADPSKACDTGPLLKLESIGFYKKIGAPTT
jgi:ABC-type nitrate/sulfonate/bicarbonate transport system substrate-binding protein